MSPMVIPGRLYIPTLIPGWAKPPSTDESELSAPLMKSQSRESSLQLKPTYHSIIESNSAFIDLQIKPLVSVIKNEGHRKINGFELGSSIGYGQFGRVYKAHLDGHVYAIKRIAKKPLNTQQYSMNQIMRQIQLWKQRGNSYNITADEAVMMMNVQKCRWEVYILSKLHSRYVVRLYECLDSPESKAIWIINKWCNLGELEWKRNSANEIPLQWSRLMDNCSTVLMFVEKALQDLVQGLLYLHEQGCIHRDIKPSNILVDSREKLLKLSDFGCSILSPRVLPFQDDILDDCFQAELNKIVGTPTFIAPELCQFGNPGAADVKDGFKLDIWSVGVTLYGLLYNELPFYGESEFATYHKVIHNTLENRLNGNKINDLIIGGMLEKDPQIRIDVRKLQKLVTLNYKPSTGSLKQGKMMTAGERKSSSPLEKHSTGFQRFFSKFLKRKKKNRSRGASAINATTNSSSISLPMGTTTSSQLFPKPSTVLRPKSGTPQNSVQNNDNDSNEWSVDSSLSSFEEPVQVSDDFFKQRDMPPDTQEALPLKNDDLRGDKSGNEPYRTNDYGLQPSVQDLGSQRLDGTTDTEISHGDERKKGHRHDFPPSKPEICNPSNDGNLKKVGAYDHLPSTQRLESPQCKGELKKIDAHDFLSSAQRLENSDCDDEPRRVDNYDCLPPTPEPAASNVNATLDIETNHDDDDDNNNNNNNNNNNDNDNNNNNNNDNNNNNNNNNGPTRIDKYDSGSLEEGLDSPVRGDEPRRIDNYSHPSLDQENASPVRGDEPRRINSYDLFKHPDYLSHSISSDTEFSGIPSYHGAFESRTPPERSRFNHSRNPSNFNSQRSGDTSFQITTNETTRDSCRGTSSATSKDPSFQLSLPPEMIQEGSPHPIKLTSRLSNESRNQSQNFHQPSNSISTSSSSPIKIPTPMRALIHMGNSPVKQDSPIQEKESNHGQNSVYRGASLAHSKDISNFQIYIETNGAPPPLDRHGSILTGDLIEKYLNYAENS